MRSAAPRSCIRATVQVLAILILAGTAPADPPIVTLARSSCRTDATWNSNLPDIGGYDTGGSYVTYSQTSPDGYVLAQATASVTATATSLSFSHSHQVTAVPNPHNRRPHTNAAAEGVFYVHQPCVLTLELASGQSLPLLDSYGNDTTAGYLNFAARAGENGLPTGSLSQWVGTPPSWTHACYCQSDQWTSTAQVLAQPGVYEFLSLSSAGFSSIQPEVTETALVNSQGSIAAEPCLKITRQPQSRDFCRTQTASLDIEAEAPPIVASLTYRWERQLCDSGLWVTLGPVRTDYCGNDACLTEVRGQGTSTLALLPWACIVFTTAAQSGTMNIRCIVSNDCASVTSETATVRICVADMDCSGAVSVGDLFVFLERWFNLDPTADLDGSGVSVQDLFSFLNAWFRGC